jgi:orotate phosphoribosyltransferase
MMDKQQLAQAIKKAAYLEGDFVLRSGKRSKYYLDKYLFETDPAILREVGELLARHAGNGVDRIGGAELGGIPLATAASLACGKPFIIIRQGKKDYGTSKMIEGTIKAGERILLVEDVVTTGGQVLEAIETIRQAGATVVKIVAVLDRMEGAAQKIRDAGCPFEALFTSADLGISVAK